MLKENFIQFYENSFKRNWELAALSDYFKNETFSYGDTATEIAKLHLLFDECHIERGDKIAIIGRNNPRWCISFLATVTYGAVVVPILQDFNANDVHHIINHSESVLLFCGDQHWDIIDVDQIEHIRGAFSLTNFDCLYQQPQLESLQSANSAEVVAALPKMQRNEIESMFTQLYPEGYTSEDIKYADVPNSNLVLLNYTSGTTGFSKGVMLSGNNLAGNILFGLNAEIHYCESRALSFLPLAHAYGCTFDFLYPLAVGSHVTLLGKIPSPKVLIEAMAKVRPTVVFCVPLIIEKMYKKQILPMLEKSVTKIALKVPIIDTGIYAIICKKLMDVFGGNFVQVIIGGAPLNKEVEEFLTRINFPFTIGYGMTECAPLISYSYHAEFKPSSCGKILEGLMEVRIDSPEPQTIPGEIYVRGENVMLGYYKNKKATAEVLTSDGWLNTGDVGTMDPDSTIYIRGRSKSMILRANGQNIYPEEIESKLNNMPCVMESLVVDRAGKLIALVYPDYEQADSEYCCHDQQSLKELMSSNMEELNRIVAPYQRIAEIVLYPNEFEKTPKRSIKRYLYNV